MARYRGYRPDSVRLAHYDYAQGGWYHLVACTKERRSDFGMVRNGIVGLSVAGCIAAWAWLRTLRTYPRAVEDEWIIMPNHVHLLLGLRARQGDADSTDRRGDVKTRLGASQRGNDRTFDGGLVPHSVSSIMNHYKGRVTKTIRRYEACPGFAWQPRFYDRIIRSQRELQAHRRYVARNPAQWTDNRNHPHRVNNR
jgi:REP element-mobilizing transposase RayT